MPCTTLTWINPTKRQDQKNHSKDEKWQSPWYIPTHHQYAKKPTQRCTHLCHRNHTRILATGHWLLLMAHHQTQHTLQGQRWPPRPEQLQRHMPKGNMRQDHKLHSLSPTATTPKTFWLQNPVRHDRLPRSPTHTQESSTSMRTTWTTYLRTICWPCQSLRHYPTPAPLLNICKIWNTKPLHSGHQKNVQEFYCQMQTGKWYHQNKLQHRCATRR